VSDSQSALAKIIASLPHRRQLPDPLSIRLAKEDLESIEVLQKALSKTTKTKLTRADALRIVIRVGLQALNPELNPQGLRETQKGTR
jgi:hypothetical protein